MNSVSCQGGGVAWCKRGEADIPGSGVFESGNHLVGPGLTWHAWQAMFMASHVSNNIRRIIYISQLLPDTAWNSLQTVCRNQEM
jgi:hypothetical protein